MIPKGNDAINKAYKAVSKVFYSNKAYAECATKYAHLEQKLAIAVAKELGLVCKEGDVMEHGIGSERVCLKSPRAKGYCMRHYQTRFRRVVYTQKGG